MKTAVLINDTSTKAHLGCRIVVAQIARLAASAGIRIAASASVHADWREHPDLMAMMRDADIVIVNGEGTLHDSSRQARALAEVAPFCREAGVPSVLINSVYERNDSDIALACRAFDRVYVRETGSAKEARDAGLLVEVVPDLTLSSNVMTAFRQQPRGTTIAVTDNANRAVGQRTLDEALTREDVRFLHLDTSEPYNPFMERPDAPEFVFMNSGRETEPLPPLPRQSTALRAFRKSLFKPHFRRRMKMFRELSEPLSSRQILSRIAISKGVVAGRFHAACMSMLSETPFAAMSSNTSKMRGMLTDAGASRLLADDPRAAFHLVDDWRDSDKTAVAAYVQRARRDAKAMFDDIASLL
ncbi:polysaccharide pyruvyl transferase family protein [Rhizobiaceae bacterium n13]|uniref:Polysaccharide pyruvyl transferase family protein n=1 Tax=Ferirhizobium litorale TaxID=2927786 RepID=A0AAE3QDQ0_9HYPH|nr:polysaccharide pyruvyl transferase family protein [Fererhizobium litorale]MDI7861202.1 polysaccharide pyruvyl transferase family protein [Fererhizobium litorale]MDI7921349.1 polysaccharide pyruvyl transferase family protein [Fererhizobium litorale]